MPTATANTTIDADVLEQIAAGEWVDGGFVMPQMDRKLYAKVKKVLEAIGGKWNRGKQATLFDDDGEAAVREAVATGTYVDLKKVYQAFYTPRDVVIRMLEIAGYPLDDEECCPKLHKKQVFEPSAGRGYIVRLLVALGAEVWAHEIREEDRQHLVDLGAHTTIGDFLQVADSEDYDLVIMNPPFTRSQDIDHVRHAYKFVKPGGILVSVMSPGFTFRSDRKATEFREWLESGNGEWSFLPDNSFSSAGTTVRTVVVSIEKPKK